MQHIISLILSFAVFFRSPMLVHQQCSVIEECIVITTGPSPQMSCYHDACTVHSNNEILRVETVSYCH